VRKTYSVSRVSGRTPCAAATRHGPELRRSPGRAAPNRPERVRERRERRALQLVERPPPPPVSRSFGWFRVRPLSQRRGARSPAESHSGGAYDAIRMWVCGAIDRAVSTLTSSQARARELSTESLVWSLSYVRSLDRRAAYEFEQTPFLHNRSIVANFVHFESIRKWIFRSVS